MRIGLGYDLHRLVEDRPLIMGGVTIPHTKGLLGHSDADVLTHALIDALLGASGLGNIGLLFPDTDPQYKGADSLVLLDETVRRVHEAGYVVGNADMNIIAQRPKLNPHIPQMKQILASRLQIAPEQVSIKPKTNEGVGPEGREEAIQAQAIVLLLQKTID